MFQSIMPVAIDNNYKSIFVAENFNKNKPNVDFDTPIFDINKINKSVSFGCVA